MKLSFLTLPLLASSEKPVKPSRQSKETIKDLDSQETEHLNSLYDCPDPLKPRNFFPLGCHKKHDEKFADSEQYPGILEHHWNEPDDYICGFHKMCMHYCRSWKSPVNQCIHPNNSNLMLKGIKCNCMCASSCTDILNEAIKSFGYREGRGFYIPDEDEEEHPVKSDKNVEDHIDTNEKYKNRRIYRDQQKMIDFIEVRLNQIDNVFELIHGGGQSRTTGYVDMEKYREEIYAPDNDAEDDFDDEHDPDHADDEFLSLLGGKSFFEAEEPEDPYFQEFFHGKPIFEASYIHDSDIEADAVVESEPVEEENPHEIPYKTGECMPSDSTAQREKCMDWNFCHPKLFPCKWPLSKLCKHCMKGNGSLPRCEPCQCKKTVEFYSDLTGRDPYLNTFLKEDFSVGHAYCAGADNAENHDDGFVDLVQRTHDEYMEIWD